MNVQSLLTHRLLKPCGKAHSYVSIVSPCLTTCTSLKAQLQYSSASQKGMEAVLLAFAVCYTGTDLGPLQHSSSPCLHLPEYCMLILIPRAASEQGYSQDTSNNDQDFLASTSKDVSFSLHLFIYLWTIFNIVFNVSILTSPISSNKLLLPHTYPSQVHL